MAVPPTQLPPLTPVLTRAFDFSTCTSSTLSPIEPSHGMVLSRTGTISDIGQSRSERPRPNASSSSSLHVTRTEGIFQKLCKTAPSVEIKATINQRHHMSLK
eukprot:scaffold9678_cov79-Cyclotella_meneghiniana.AAC.10